MKKIRSKLRSESGAALVLALIFMLIAMMVSAVIVASAQTAAETAHAKQRSEQAYLSVSSAARFMEARITGADLTITGEGTEVNYTGDFTNTPFFPLIKRALTYINTNGETFEESFYIVGNDENVDPVYVRFVMDDIYDIELYCRLGEETKNDYYMELILLSDYDDYGTEKRLRWGDPVYIKGWE